MKQVVIIFLLFLRIQMWAQEEPNSKIQHFHLLELSYNIGYSFSGIVIGDAYSPRAFTWKIHDNTFHKLNLGCYVGKRIEVGTGCNIYQWRGQIKFRIFPGHPYDARCTALSAYVFSNYYFPTGIGKFYAGVAGGYAKSFGTPNVGLYRGFFNGHGYECNVHIGDKITLVKDKFWINVEIGATQTMINTLKAGSIGYNGEYAIDNFSVVAGLMFRM